MSRSFGFIACAVSILASTGVACSSSSDDASSGAAGSASAASDFAEAYARALCDNAGPCCKEARYDHDAARCRAAVVTSIRATLEPFEGGVFNSKTGEALVADIEKMVTSCTEPAEGSAEAKALALKFFSLYTATGTGAPGASCRKQNDCAPIAGARTLCAMDLSSDGASGRCTAYRPASEGMRCFDDDVFELGNCGFDDYTGTGEAFYCDATEKVCRSRVALGGACSDSEECAKGSWCLDGKCAPLSLANERCTSFSDCATGLRCDSDASVCVPLKKGGEACEMADECASSRCGEGRCAAISLLTSGACSGAL
ncbi:MAG: hypothetical protein KF764_35275 [Labilithrix sp.]|nr:hypothetical protein [Labilithrix sp.]